MWIARDSDGSLWVYEEKPIRRTNVFQPNFKEWSRINNDLFQEVTWENSPKELIIKD